MVAIVEEHMAHGATVEESAMVTPIRDGDPCEVDALMTSRAGRHEVQVGIEAGRWSRKADVGWVEKMKAKHDDLPTNKLVLYSKSGFTKGAVHKAAEHGIATLEAEELPAEELERRVLNGLRSIWPKVVSLTPQRAKVWIPLLDGQIVWFKAPADLNLYLENGSDVGPPLNQAVLAKIQSQWEQIIDQIGLRDIPESMERPFQILWRPFSIIIDGMEERLHARKEDVQPPELHPIEQVEVTGRATIQVQKVSLTHMRLGETRVAYGEVKLLDRPGLVVASNGAEEELLSLRVLGAVVSTQRLPQTARSRGRPDELD